MTLAGNLTLTETLTLAAFWTPYADWIFTGMSTTMLLVVIALVLRPTR